MTEPGAHLPDEVAEEDPRGDGAAAHGITGTARSQRRMVLRRFVRHRLAMASLVVFVLLVLVSFVGAALWTYDHESLTRRFSQPPSWDHPFGTDSSGRDGLALVLRGSQRSIQIALFVAVAATAIGTVLGAVAGFARGMVDAVIMRVADIFLTVPAIALAALLGYQLGASASGWIYIAIVFSLLFWAPMARVVRGVTLSLREKEFVEASRALGASTPRIIFRHIVPNAAGPIIVNATVYVAIAILAETALSFVGFGVRSPDVSLGTLVSAAASAAATRPWLFYFPGLFIILIALTINFIGDGLRDALDPRQTRVRA